MQAEVFAGCAFSVGFINLVCLNEKTVIAYSYLSAWDAADGEALAEGVVLSPSKS